MKHSPKVLHPKDKTDFLSRHHCYPIGRMKTDKPPVNVKYPDLTIKLWRKRHDAWHLLFRYATIDEIILRLSWDFSVYQNDHYAKIFKCSKANACFILQRLKRIKTRNHDPIHC